MLANSQGWLGMPGAYAPAVGRLEGNALCDSQEPEINWHESQCPWDCNCGSRSLSRVAVGSLFSSESSLSGDEPGFLVKKFCPSRWHIFCASATTGECLQQ